MADNAEASGGEELTGSGPHGRASLQGGVAPVDGAQRRRKGGQEVQEVVDELAQETRRTSLLDRVEQQLRDQHHVSRIFFGFSVVDDRKIHSQIDQEFNAWRQQNDKHQQEVTGLLVYMGQVAIHFLEGPTELLFKAVEAFEKLSQEITDSPAARPALLSSLRILHFTELHGIRTSAGWCSTVHPGKAGGGNVQQIDDSNNSEQAFFAYRKIMLLSLNVRDAVGDDPSTEELSANYKKGADMLPTVDEVLMLMGKIAAEYFFTYPEFEKVFIAPFNLILHSELLWPMPPDLSY